MGKGKSPHLPRLVGISFAEDDHHSSHHHDERDGHAGGADQSHRHFVDNEEEYYADHRDKKTEQAHTLDEHVMSSEISFQELPREISRKINGRNFSFAGFAGADLEAYTHWLDMFNKREDEAYVEHSLIPKMPDPSTFQKEGQVVAALGLKIKTTRVVVTAWEVCFDGRGGQLADRLPLVEIESMSLSDDTVTINTFTDGLNSGRVYKITATDAYDWEHAIRSAWDHRIKHRDDYYRNLRIWWRKTYDGVYVQSLLSLLICASFGVICIVVQVQPEEGSELAQQTVYVDVMFTCIFIADLALNFYAHYFWAFFRNPWNNFDAVVVFISFIWIMNRVTLNNPRVDVLKHVRAFRIFRVAGKIRQLRKLVDAIGESLMPMIYGCCMSIIFLCIFCVLGTEFFKTSDPDNFGTFARTFYTLFLALAFGIWQADLPFLYEDTKTVNYLVLFYVMLFTIFMIWISLQVVLAILLENFVTAQTRDKGMDDRANLELRARENVADGGLDSLMKEMLRVFDTSHDMAKGITRIFLFLDTDESGAISYTEFYMGMKKLHAKPHVEVSDFDWDILTHDYTLLDERKCLNMASFHRLMRRQLKNYVQRHVTDVMTMSEDVVGVSWTLGALRMVLLDELTHPPQDDGDDAGTGRKGGRKGSFRITRSTMPSPEHQKQLLPPEDPFQFPDIPPPTELPVRRPSSRAVEAVDTPPRSPVRSSRRESKDTKSSETTVGSNQPREMTEAVKWVDVENVLSEIQTSRVETCDLRGEVEDVKGQLQNIRGDMREMMRKMEAMLEILVVHQTNEGNHTPAHLVASMSPTWQLSPKNGGENVAVFSSPREPRAVFALEQPPVPAAPPRPDILPVHLERRPSYGQGGLTLTDRSNMTLPSPHRPEMLAPAASRHRGSLNGNGKTFNGARFVNAHNASGGSRDFADHLPSHLLSDRSHSPMRLSPGRVSPSTPARNSIFVSPPTDEWEQALASSSDEMGKGDQ